MSAAASPKARRRLTTQASGTGGSGASQGPLGSAPLASTMAELWAVVMHPAFRLGALDAAAGRPLDHWRIVERMLTETPPRALAALPAFMSAASHIDLAQYRYEEGRLAVLMYGLTWRGWSRPDYPPAAVLDLCRRLAERRASPMASRSVAWPPASRRAARAAASSADRRT